jgi:hypothetical protein
MTSPDGPISHGQIARVIYEGSSMPASVCIASSTLCHFCGQKRPGKGTQTATGSHNTFRLPGRCVRRRPWSASSA